MDRFKAIPTRYNGIEFRSRAEARWAMLFDLLEIKWSYETEGYQLQTCWYLPDFWLSGLNAFAEVKGATEQWDYLAEIKASDLVKAHEKPLLVCTEVAAPLLLTALVPDPTVPWGYESYTCDLAASALHERLWLDKEKNHDSDFVDLQVLTKINSVRSYRFYARAK